MTVIYLNKDLPDDIYELCDEANDVLTEQYLNQELLAKPLFIKLIIDKFSNANEIAEEERKTIQAKSELRDAGWDVDDMEQQLTNALDIHCPPKSYLPTISTILLCLIFIGSFLIACANTQEGTVKNLNSVDDYRSLMKVDYEDNKYKSAMSPSGYVIKNKEQLSQIIPAFINNPSIMKKIIDISDHNGVNINRIDAGGVIYYRKNEHKQRFYIHNKLYKSIYIAIDKYENIDLFNFSIKTNKSKAYPNYIFSTDKKIRLSEQEKLRFSQQIEEKHFKGINTGDLINMSYLEFKNKLVRNIRIPVLFKIDNEIVHERDFRSITL